MSDLANLSLVDAAEAVRTGNATAMELLDACLAYLEIVNEAIRATIWVDRDGA